MATKGPHAHVRENNTRVQVKHQNRWRWRLLECTENNEKRFVSGWREHYAGMAVTYEAHKRGRMQYEGFILVRR